MFDQQSFIRELSAILNDTKLILDPAKIRPYATGIKIGGGDAFAVLQASSLLELWQLLQCCVKHDVIVIMQAANTGVTAGSTPEGNDYDRPVVIISTLMLNQTVLLNQGSEVLAYPGATLYELEEKLAPLHREPHSVIGSSCIGASIVGGICNSSGGSLVNRGPAYTELSLYAQLDQDRELHLMNELGIELGETPEQILSNLDTQNFNLTPNKPDDKLASDVNYQARVRDIDAQTPSRYNADPRRLYKSSGCAGKLAVFAVRLDTFKQSERSKVFYIGTHEPQQLAALRKTVLRDFKTLPELGEYMHASCFDASDRYCKDIFLIIKKLGSHNLAKMWQLNTFFNSVFDKFRVFPEKLAERISMRLAKLLPDHLPARVRAFRNRFEHHLIIKAVDDNIEETRQLLEATRSDALDYFECNEREAEDVLLHRFVAGNAMARCALIQGDKASGMAPLDVALRRNDHEWYDLIPQELNDKLLKPIILSHFFCNVFHLDLLIKKGFDPELVKQEFLDLLARRGAKYPAEHNVGHYYQAETSHQAFYQSLDPCNSFNAGIGKMSKNRDYR